MPLRLPLLKILLCVLISTALGWGLVSCGKKTNPVAPAKVVPKAVEDLSYRIQGESLVLTWTPPKTNTDGSPLADLKGFQLEKGTFPVKGYCATCPDQFQEKQALDPKGPEMPGVRVEDHEVAITYESLQPGNVYLFRVVVESKRGVSSDPSKTLKVAWDLPLSPPVLRALKPRSEGVEIAWEAPSTLVDGSPAAGIAGYLVFRKAGQGNWEKVTEKPVSELSWVDKGVQEGGSYAYRVKALREAYGNLLESAVSKEQDLTFTRIAPPPAVQELVAVMQPGAVQLRWQELDIPVQGYRIYRRTAKEKTPQSLNRQPVAATLYEDRQVAPGVVYYYSVSAVGPGPHFIEGPRSGEMEITYNP